MKLVPIDTDPFSGAPAAPIEAPRPRKLKLEPIEHDPFQPQGDGVGLADYWQAIKSGAFETVAGVGQLAKWAGADETGPAIVEFGQSRSEQARAGMSPAGRAAMAQEFAVENPDSITGYSPGPALTNPAAIGLNVAASLPSTAASLLPGGAGAKVLQIGGKVAPWLAGAIGYGAAEGILTAGQNAAEVEKRVRELPLDRLAAAPEFQAIMAEQDEALPVTQRAQAARDELARRISGETGIKTGLATAALGGPGGAVMETLVRGGGRSLGRSIAIGAATEVPVEAAQSAAEQAIQNVAEQRADATIPTGQGVVNAATAGAVVGGAMGGATGGGANLYGRARGLQRPLPANVPQDAQEQQADADPLPTAPSPGQAASEPVAPTVPATAAVQPTPTGAAIDDEIPAFPQPLVQPAPVAQNTAVSGLVTEQPSAAAPVLQPVDTNPFLGDGSSIGDGSRQAPLRPSTPEAIDQAALERVAPEPSDAQKAAGNYRKAHIKWNGLDLSIENPAGSERRGTDPDGKPWSVTMPAHYGYVKRSEGFDGDQVDIYLGPGLEAPSVYIVDQIDPGTGRFDEHKVMAGFDRAGAINAYRAAFSDGSALRRIGAITEMTVPEFKVWLADPKRTKAPLAYQEIPTSTRSPPEAAPPAMTEAAPVEAPPAELPDSPPADALMSPDQIEARKAEIRAKVAAGTGELTREDVAFLNANPAPSRRAPAPATAKRDRAKTKFQREAPAKPFYSAMTRAVEAMPQPKAPAQQWAASIRNLTQKGVKQEEIDWSGVSDWLSVQQGTVTREAVAQYLRDNEVGIKEITLQPRDDVAVREYHELSEKLWRRMSEDERSAYRKTAGQRPSLFDSYTLPGGKEYRELLLTMPEKKTTKRYRVEGDGPGTYIVDQETGSRQFAGNYGDARRRVEEMNAQASGRPAQFVSGHFDTPNILAHIRFNERTDADGRRVLFIEEIQSDWHQAGRKKGYRSDEAKLKAAYDAAIEAQAKTRTDAPGYAEAEQATREAMRAWMGATASVPDAPLKSTWHEAAFRRAVRWAAENGFDRIAWTTGDQQADRYDLSKQINAIDYAKSANGETVSINAYRRVGDGMLRNVFSRANTPVGDVEGILGKDLAKKISDDEGSIDSQTGYTRLGGVDLKVGGDGMRGFYDKILPAYAAKWGKRFGAGVNRAEVSAGAPDPRPWKARDDTDPSGVIEAEFKTRAEADAWAEENGGVRITHEPGGTVQAHAMEITPAMRDAVLQGVPLFQREGQSGQPEIKTGDDLPVAARLTGTELGAPAEDLRGLLEQARTWYAANLIGTRVTASDGRTIGFDNRGTRKSTGRIGEHLARAIPAIPAVLEKGVLIGSEPDRDGADRIKAWHKYAARVMIGETPVDVVVTVRELPDGTFHYSLNRWDDAAGPRAQGPEGGSTVKAERLTPWNGRPDDVWSIAEFRPGDNIASGPVRRVLAPDLSGEYSLAPEWQAKRESVARLTGGALARMTGRPGLRVEVADRLLGRGPDGSTTGVSGAFAPIENLVALSLTAPDPLATARHEAIHVLRETGLLDQARWAVLERAAAEQGWIEKHGIAARYPDLSQEARLEEAVAEEFASRGAAPARGVAAVFAKIKEFLAELRAILTKAFGRTPTWADVFRQIETGRVAKSEFPLDDEQPRESARDVMAQRGGEIYRAAELIAKYAEQSGWSVDRKFGSNLSHSHYIELVRPIAFDEDGDTVDWETLKIRVSDHALPPSYKMQHGEADFEVSPEGSLHQDAHSGDWKDAIAWLAKRSGKELPSVVSRVAKAQATRANNKESKRLSEFYQRLSERLGDFDTQVRAGNITANQSNSGKTWYLKRADNGARLVDVYDTAGPFSQDTAIQRGREKIVAEMGKVLGELTLLGADTPAAAAGVKQQRAKPVPLAEPLSTEKQSILDAALASFKDWRAAPRLPLTRDLTWAERFALHPRMLASTFPAFTRVWRAATAQLQLRDATAAQLSSLLKPYQSLGPQARTRVDAVLELGRLQNETYDGPTIGAVNRHGDTELSRFGERITLSPEEGEAYRSVRATMDKALDLLQEAVLDERGYGGPGGPGSADAMRASIRADMPEIEAQHRNETAQILDEIANAKRTGYVPFMRYGDMGLVVKNKDGEVVHFEKLETDGPFWRRANRSLASGRIARRVAAVRAKYPGHKVSGPFEIAPAAMERAGVSLQDIDVLAASGGADQDSYAQVRDAIDAALRARSFNKHFFGAKNTAGYSVDFERGLADYIVGLSGYLSRRATGREFDDALKAIPPIQAKLRLYAARYRDYVNSPQEEWQKARAITFFYYLAGNISSALVNVTQVPLISMPYLAQIAGMGRANAELIRASADVMKMLSIREKGVEIFDIEKAPSDVRDALRAAWEEGFVVPQQTYEQMATAQGRNKALRGVDDKLRAAAEVAASVFTAAERFNRLATFVATYRLGQDKSVMARAKTVYGRDPLYAGDEKYQTPAGLADWVIDETHLRMGKINRPEAMRGVGSWLLQFKGFTMQMLELFWRLTQNGGPEGRLAFAGIAAMLVAFGGLFGIPAGSDMKDWAERIYKFGTDRDLDIETEIRRGMTRLTGSPLIAEAIVKGLPRAAGIDLSGRIGMGQIAPDSLADSIGVPGELTLGRLQRAANNLKRGDALLAASEFMPQFLRNPMQAVAWSNSGIRSQQTGKVVIPASEIGAADVAMKAVGFTSADIANRRESEYAQQRESRAVAGMQAGYTGKLARLYAEMLVEQDPVKKREAYEAINAVRLEIAEYNKTAPISRRIMISSTTLRARVQEEQIGARARDRGAPKKTRQERSAIAEAYGTP